jgi:hypothetical protein
LMMMASRALTQAVTSCAAPTDLPTKPAAGVRNPLKVSFRWDETVPFVPTCPT